MVWNCSTVNSMCCYINVLINQDKSKVDILTIAKGNIHEGWMCLEKENVKKKVSYSCKQNTEVLHMEQFYATDGEYRHKEYKEIRSLEKVL